MKTTRISAFAILLVAFEQLNLLIGAHAAALEPQQQPTLLLPSTGSATGPGRFESGPEVGMNSELDIDIPRQDNRRPIWAVAHMVNSIKELEYRLEKGANAIEADVTFSRDGTPTHTYHGPPCDCWRHCHQQEAFADFLTYVRAVSIETADGVGQNLTLLFLDLKLDSLDQVAKERAGQELAEAIVKHLYQESQDGDQPDETQDERERRKSLAKARSRLFNLILSVNHVNDIDLIRNFMHTLEVNNSSHLLIENIGFDVGMNDQLPMIEAMWRKLLKSGSKLNLWQGDGFTNCLSPFYNLERLSSAIGKRDNPSGYPAKVYHWTIDLHDRLRESLLMGVDAIMTNHPERLVTVLREPNIAHDFRLATRADNPFKKLTKGSLGRRDETARYQRSAYTPASGLLSNLMDVLASWVNYFREIPLLSYPTTLLSRSSSSSSAKRRSTTVKEKKKGETTTVVLTPNGRQSPNVTQVILDNEPEYKVLANATATTVTNTTTTSAAAVAAESTISTNRTETSTSSSDVTKAMDQNGADAYNADYEGPKWYTSLMSHLLISWMRVVLPPPAHETI